MCAGQTKTGNTTSSKVALLSLYLSLSLSLCLRLPPSASPSPFYYVYELFDGAATASTVAM